MFGKIIATTIIGIPLVSALKQLIFCITKKYIKMAVKYHVVQRKDPRDSNLPVKYYAEITDRYEINYNQLLKEITDISTVSIGDTYNVLQTLSYLIKKNIQEGRSLNIGDLGIFYMTLNSEGNLSPDDVNSKNITRSVIRFRACRSLKEVLYRLSFKKSS